MVAPALKQAAWVGAAMVAVGVIVALALHGRRPDPGLVRFEPGGVMVQVPPARVTAVELSRDGRRWRFTRTEGRGWTAVPGTPPSSEDEGARIERGLRFLHVSAPQRMMAREEFSGTPMAELGLDPPRYAVSVRSSAGAALTVEFGTLNPQGLAQYARVMGRDEILLLPSYVGEPWERLTEAP